MNGDWVLVGEMDASTRHYTVLTDRSRGPQQQIQVNPLFLCNAVSATGFEKRATGSGDGVGRSGGAANQTPAAAGPGDEVQEVFAEQGAAAESGEQEPAVFAIYSE